MVTIMLGVMMRYSWTGKGVNLETLISAVERFFAERGFSERKVSSEDKNEHTILVSIRREGKPRTARVMIKGSSDNFEIDFSVDRSADVFAKLGLLTTMLGGGFVIRGKLGDIGFFERLESDFWNFVDSSLADFRS